MEDPTMAGALEITSEVRAGRATVAEIVAAHLSRIEEFNPIVNAICTLNPDAMADAEAADTRLGRGEAPRPLEGVPFIAKDNIWTKGLRTTYGSRVMEDFIPDKDSVVVERLRAAGAVLLGKSNIPEFAHDVNSANFIFGTTRNPWALNRTAGGSSGGSAAALAARFAPLALGTDLGGSIRGPSSFNNTVGIRPTPGRVPDWPTDLAWGAMVSSVTGPMTRNVADAAAMMAVLSGPDDRDPATLPDDGMDYLAAATTPPPMTGKRIAFSPDINGLVPVAPGVAAIAKAAAERFRDLGAEVVEDCFDASDLVEIIAGTRSYAMVARYAERHEAYKEKMTPPLLAQIEAGLRTDIAAMTRAERMRGDYWQRVRVFLETYDYIITPTVGVPAFRLDRPLPTKIGEREVERYYDSFLATYCFSLTGLPIIAVPAGLSEDGLPVGIQIVGRRLRDDEVIAAGAAYEAAAPELFRTPEIDPAQAVELGEAFSSPGLVLKRPM